MNIFKKRTILFILMLVMLVLGFIFGFLDNGINRFL